MAKNGNSKGWNKKHPLVRLKRRLKLTYLKLLRLDDPPERIARGVAIGVFMGILPTFGLGGLMAVGLAFILRANKAASVFGSFVMNPLTMPFFMTSSALLGSSIFREDSATIVAKYHEAGHLLGAVFDTISFATILAKTLEGTKILFSSLWWYLVVFMVGNTIINIIFTVASYYATKEFIIRHRKKKAARRLARVQADMAEHARLHPTHHHEIHHDKSKGE